MVVFETPKGLLLAGGHHRVAAARSMGLELVEAEVRRGSRRAALQYAARVGSARCGISIEEAGFYIERRGRDPDSRGPVREPRGRAGSRL